MKKKLASVFALLMFAYPIYAATAYWTGRSWPVTTVTGKRALRCQYEVYALNGKQYVYRIFEFSCPSSIDVY